MRIKRRFQWLLTGLIPGLAAFDLPAQTLTPESASKVQRILLYNNIGGWFCGTCRDETAKVFFQMGQSRGFQVDTTSSAADLTADNLKRYQVIVWNNNSNGAASVPDTSARAAVEEYVRQGGGWMLVNLANDHGSSWPFLRFLVGPGTSGWRGGNVPGVLVADSAAEKHPELRHLVAAMPDSLPLRTNWMRVETNWQLIFDPDSYDRFWNDEVVHRTPLFRLKDAAALFNSPYRDIGEDYVWANAWEKGRALSIPLGWVGSPFGNDIMRQADSAVPKLYWQGLRWLAGDYAGECAGRESTESGSGSRADAEPCDGTPIRTGHRHQTRRVEISGRRLHLAAGVSGGIRVQVRDVQGRSVWVSTLPGSSTTIDLPGRLRTGIYVIAITGIETPLRIRIMIP